jgi:carbon monoxide dehydrogenase subunit G
MKFSSTVIVHAPIVAVWTAVKDVRRVAEALPNAQLESIAPDGTAAARMKLKVGPMSVSYQGTAKAIETDEDRRSISYSVQGRQTQGVGSVSAAIQITCESQSQKTSLHIEAETTISGLAAQLGGGLIETVGHGILNDFAGRFGKSLSSDGSAAPAQSPALAEPSKADARARLVWLGAVCLALIVGFAAGRLRR